MTIGRRPYPVRATVTNIIESEGIKGEAAKIGAGAGVGAIISGGGTVAATDGIGQASSLITARAAAIVLSTSLRVCAAERNQPSNCEGGG